MAFYIQYDPTNGAISATVTTGDSAPPCPNQICIEDGWVPTDGMRVNLETLQLEAIPQE